MTDWGLVEEILARGESVEVEVRGTSMYPSIFSGEKVVLRPMNGAGAVAEKCYLTRAAGAYRLHRAVPLSDGMSTRGDNLEYPDPMPEAWLGELVLHKRTWKGQARRILQRLRQLKAEEASFGFLMLFSVLMGAAFFPLGQAWKIQASDFCLLLSLAFALACGFPRRVPALAVFLPLAFAAWSLVSAAVNSAGWLAGMGQLELAVLPGLVCFHCRTEENLLKLLRYWCAAAAALAAVGVAGGLVTAAGYQISWGGMGGALGLSFRPKGLSHSTNLLASFSLAPAIFLLSPLKKKLFPARTRAIFLLALAACFALSFSRSLLALALGALLLSRVPRALKATGFLALALLVFLSARFEWAMPSGELAAPFSEGARWKIQESALSTFFSSPWLGIGPGESAAVISGYPSPQTVGSTWRAHNTWIGLAATVGAPGAILFLLTLMSPFSSRTQSIISRTLVVALAAMLFDSFSVDSERFRHLWLLLGMCLAARAYLDYGARSSGIPNSSGH